MFDYLETNIIIAIYIDNIQIIGFNLEDIKALKYRLY